MYLALLRLHYGQYATATLILWEKRLGSLTELARRKWLLLIALLSVAEFGFTSHAAHALWSDWWLERRFVEDVWKGIHAEYSLRLFMSRGIVPLCIFPHKLRLIRHCVDVHWAVPRGKCVALDCCGWALGRRCDIPFKIEVGRGKRRPLSPLGHAESCFVHIWARLLLFGLLTHAQLRLGLLLVQGLTWVERR